MTPQAIRLPALPVGSVFMSSAFSCTTMAVPPLARMLLAVARRQREVVDLEADLPGVVFADGDVLRQVAVVVAHRVHRSVLLAGRVEVAARALEVGRIADRMLVDVDGVLAKGKVLEVELDGEFAVLELAEGGGACVLARRWS